MHNQGAIKSFLITWRINLVYNTNQNISETFFEKYFNGSLIVYVHGEVIR